jgi:hypothetical protein
MRRRSYISLLAAAAVACGGTDVDEADKGARKLSRDAETVNPDDDAAPPVAGADGGAVRPRRVLVPPTLDASGAAPGAGNARPGGGDEPLAAGGDPPNAAPDADDDPLDTSLPKSVAPGLDAGSDSGSGVPPDAGDGAAVDTGADAPADAAPDASEAGGDDGGADGTLTVLDGGQTTLKHDPGRSDPVREKLEACGALGAGDFVPPRSEDARQRCLVDCMLKVSCSDLHHFLCQESAPEMDLCRTHCETLQKEQPFACGGGQLIWPGLVCDGLYDCENLADETDACGVYTCADGSLVAAPARCDGFASCADASDEANCALPCPTL